MNFAAKLACVKFSSQEEMLSFKADFQCALAFISKLDEVDVKGQEPLGNVFEYYKGNELKMRSVTDFTKDDHQNYRPQFLKINKHATKDGVYAVYPKTTQPNPDGE